MLLLLLIIVSIIRILLKLPPFVSFVSFVSLVIVAGAACNDVIGSPFSYFIDVLVAPSFLFVSSQRSINGLESQKC